MTLSWTLADPCLICGCRLQGICVASVRVNKRSLRVADRGGLVAVFPKCPECLAPTNTESHKWALDAKSKAQLEAYRARKWDLATT